MPSFNDITGARISSGVHVKGTDREKYSDGWDTIFGKKEYVKEIEGDWVILNPEHECRITNTETDEWTAYQTMCMEDVLKDHALINEMSEERLRAFIKRLAGQTWDIV